MTLGKGITYTKACENKRNIYIDTQIDFNRSTGHPTTVCFQYLVGPFESLRTCSRTSIVETF